MKSKTKLKPWVAVHDVAEAKRALRLAEAEGLAVGLLSPPDCALVQGAPWFLHLVDLASAGQRRSLREAALDCGNAPGLALGALRAGAKTIILRAQNPVFDKVARIAATHRAAVLPKRPPALETVEPAALVAYYDRFRA